MIRTLNDAGRQRKLITGGFFPNGNQRPRASHGRHVRPLGAKPIKYLGLQRPKAPQSETM